MILKWSAAFSMRLSTIAFLAIATIATTGLGAGTPTKRVTVTTTFALKNEDFIAPGSPLPLSGSFKVSFIAPLSGGYTFSNLKAEEISITPDHIGATVFNAENTGINVYSANGSFDSLIFGGLQDGVERFSLSVPPAAGASSDLMLNFNRALGGSVFNYQTDGSVPFGYAVDFKWDMQVEEAATERLINISARSFVGVGSEAQIAGFVIAGTAPKRVLVRVSGPSLKQFGLNNLLVDPILSLYNAQNQKIGENDNWDSSLKAAAPTVGWWWPDGSKEAAILVSLDPGAYTAIVAGKDGGTGTALVEVYELAEEASELINVSARGMVKNGDDVMIGGFIISGAAPKKVLIRASGPALTQYGVSNVLTDPVLQIFSGAVKIAENDNWDSSAKDGAPTIPWTWTVGSRDAALVLTLDPGTYTAVVSGKNGSTGVALLECFELP